MMVGNVCYVTHHYNEQRFRNFLELQLSEKKGAKPLSNFLEESIAALLDFNDSKDKKEVFAARMEFLLSSLEISYMDFRSYDENSTSGNPEDAIKAFNKIATDAFLE